MIKMTPANNNTSSNKLLTQMLNIVCSALILLSAGCVSTTTVKTTQPIPLDRVLGEIPEAELLDLGVHLFDPGLDATDEDKNRTVFTEIRNAESRFMAYQLAQTLQESAAWGAVRVIPSSHTNTDVTVAGTILQSDGEQLKLSIAVTDATGKLWYEKKYTGLASKYAYSKERTSQVPAEPFQSLYNEIANDILHFRQQQFTGTELRAIRTTAELKFAQSFSPASFSDLLQQNKKGEYDIVRLPAENDPTLQRVRVIRERDYLFIDTLQDYYGSFVKEMDDPYREWRSQSYNEVVALRKLQREARRDTILGVASLIGGIVAAGSNNGSTSTAGAVAVAAGGYMIKSGFDKRAESEMHIEALQELGDSLEAEIEPQIIELEDRTITLTGTVENQYQQWRDILKEIYQQERGF